MAASITPTPSKPSSRKAAERLVVRVTLERETKLSVERGFRLPDGLGAPLLPRTFISDYFDTTDFRLARAGVTLRLRKEAGRRLWQLKVGAVRGRWELELEDGGSTPPARLTDLLLVHLRGMPVELVGRLRTWRATVRVQEDGQAIADVVLDTVSVLDQRRVIRSFREVEIEAAEGDEAQLAQLEKQLRLAGAGDHDGRPKLLRALDLPAKQAPVPPHPNAPVPEHLIASLTAHVESLIAQDPLVRLGTDPEAVHQMRVAGRRFRAVLRAASPLLEPAWADPLRAEVAWLGTVLGAARDLDVQIEYFEQEAKTLDRQDRAPIARLIRKCKVQREIAQERLLAELRSDRYLALMDRLMSASREPKMVQADVALRDLAAQEFRRLRKCVRNLPEHPADAELHRVRIKAKRARYAAELAATTVGKSAWRFVEGVRALQDLLGAHQDAVVGEARVRTFLEGAGSMRAAFAAGQMVERLRRRRHEARGGWSKIWKRVKKRGEKAWG